VIVATAIVSIVAFLVALWAFGVVRVGASTLATVQGAANVLTDSSLDDAAREKAVQRASLRLFGDFVSIAVRGGLSVAAAILPLWLAAWLDLAPIDDVVRFLSRWDVMIVATVVIVAGYVAARRFLPR